MTVRNQDLFRLSQMTSNPKGNNPLEQGIIPGASGVISVVSPIMGSRVGIGVPVGGGIGVRVGGISTGFTSLEPSTTS